MVGSSGTGGGGGSGGSFSSWRGSSVAEEEASSPQASRASRLRASQGRGTRRRIAARISRSPRRGQRRPLAPVDDLAGEFGGVGCPDRQGLVGGHPGRQGAEALRDEAPRRLAHERPL